MKLMAYAFDSRGQLLGSSVVDSEGNVSVALKLVRPADVELVIGPADDPQDVRKSSAYSQRFAAGEWVGSGTKYRLRPDIILRRDMWLPWLPSRICISGHVRKTHEEDSVTVTCPVPFVKVENLRC